MIEIYVFINPLGSICLEAERQILQFVQSENKKIQFRFIPLVNMNTINDVVRRRSNEGPMDLMQRNQLFEDIYSAALDYKAIQLQGKKKGRKFLLTLQEKVACEKVPYSQELVDHLILEADGDLAMFHSDRVSDFVKESFQSDQQIAREMGITKHPSAVVYNYACERDFGVIVENFHSIEEIQELCRTNEQTYRTFHDGLLPTVENSGYQHRRNLRLV